MLEGADAQIGVLLLPGVRPPRPVVFFVVGLLRPRGHGEVRFGCGLRCLHTIRTCLVCGPGFYTIPIVECRIAGEIQFSR